MIHFCLKTVKYQYYLINKASEYNMPIELLVQSQEC